MKVLALGLLGFASAVPVSSRQAPSYPATSKSNGFYLVAKVADPSKELDPPVDGWAVNTVHTGAGLNEAILLDNPSTNSIFYQNGTAEQI